MKKHTGPRLRVGRVAGLALGIGSLAVAAPSCDHTIDTTRQGSPKATLGDDIYGAMCDRLGASSLTEDLAGASYASICHFDRQGQYGDFVDASVLPPVSSAASVEARRLGVAKLERLATHRAALIRALNVALPDVVIPDLTTADPADTVRLHDALLTFSQDLSQLYDTNPYEPGLHGAGAPPIQPMATQALGRLFGSLGASEPARQALQRISGRQGYRPWRIGMGAIRTLLAYPEMRSFARAQLEVLGPNGPGAPALQQLFHTARAELGSAAVTVSPLGLYQVDPATAQPNRPRSALEVTAAMALDESVAYEAPGGDPTRYITRRDRRGFVVPFGNTPGVLGTVAAPFADANADGFADVDLLGRFIDGAGLPLPLDPPFLVPGAPSASPLDEFGRPVASLYEYIDTSATLLGALPRDLLPLLDPVRYAVEGDPEAYRVEHEAVMYALAGMQVLAGPREPAQYEPVSEAIVPVGQPCDGCLQYTRFRGEDSPIADLLHAAGQVLAHPDSDAILQGLIVLLEQHPRVVARLIAAALDVKAVADNHDTLAAQGFEPKAELAYEVPLWDEIAQVVHRMAGHPGLIGKLVDALGDPVIVQSHTQEPLISGAPSGHLGQTISTFALMRDRFSYNRWDGQDGINGPTVNLTDGYPSFANPHNPVDRSQPLQGANRSLLERSIQLIADGKGVQACNKQGAQLYHGLSFLGGGYFPIDYAECELFVFRDINAVYLGATLPLNHPKRAQLEVEPEELDILLDLINNVLSADVLLETSSGLDGMTLRPSPKALARLMFFGAASDKFGQLPDHDGLNVGTNTELFVRSAVEPVGSVVCPKNGKGVNTCATAADVIRVRAAETIFAWERLGFTQYLLPQLKVFAELSCNEAVTACDTHDFTGENFFVDLNVALWRHWPGPDHGDYCSPNDPARYCSEAGVNRYEPILGEALRGDLIPALHEFAKVSRDTNITVARGPKAGQQLNGGAIQELIVKVLFDQSYAASVGMANRAGGTAATWTDGTPQAQLTGYTLFADALHRIDTRFATACEGLAGEPRTACDADVATRKAKWKRARSELVDVLLRIDGSGPTAEFADPGAVRRMVTILKVLREQLNANCPDRESTGQCDWASRQLGNKLAGVLSRPLFAAVSDVGDAVNQHEPARRALELFLSYALLPVGGQDALEGVLASLSDMVQLLVADADFAPILQAAAVATSPRDAPEGPGAADRMVHILTAMTGDAYDRYHVLDHVLPALVTPIDGGAGRTPLEVIVDAIADVSRLDASLGTPLDAADLAEVFDTVREFLTSETRGLEQLYFIVQNRRREE